MRVDLEIFIFLKYEQYIKLCTFKHDHFLKWKEYYLWNKDNYKLTLSLLKKKKKKNFVITTWVSLSLQACRTFVIVSFSIKYRW